MKYIKSYYELFEFINTTNNQIEDLISNISLQLTNDKNYINSFINKGVEGWIYEYGNDKVIKIFRDVSSFSVIKIEERLNSYLYQMDKNIPELVKIYDVGKIIINNKYLNNNYEVLYYVIMEKLNTKKVYKKFEYLYKYLNNYNISIENIFESNKYENNLKILHEINKNTNNKYIDIELIINSLMKNKIYPLDLSINNFGLRKDKLVLFDFNNIKTKKVYKLKKIINI